MIVRINNYNDLNICNLNSYINVYKGRYSRELSAFFIRTRYGVLVFVNENLTINKQGECIKIIENKINQIPDIDSGMINKHMQFISDNELILTQDIGG